ncbi:N-acetylmannosamine-6-phosphate 2-epimerase [Rubellimicrobium sp. CFH 75288]|uniref:N-acetylmannosamine-6-phosphate 2-epimerase n=1 Tax=Rubellimicrobium sp. CFH 75288 TaxID=2697034 RepID=UPI001412A8FE|nr:putative N-acetylmannosamine-6-phosphate 2-epimerase [Rubellimicrobium sp. CFH 75288]NAZ36578.1 putative N-acetylmannosamine-6-phosphate 2-epimerase [Rubellimicrobium sp. CFH 75288]
MADLLDGLRGGLIVSCQPVPGGPLDRPDIVAALALAALAGGARGLRIEGVENLRAVRAATRAPVIGLVKTDRADSPVRITPTAAEARALVEAGADVVAFDATDRPRPEPLERIVGAIHEAGALAMADCASLADGRRAAALGCAMLGSTLSGYLGGAVPEGPDLGLVAELAGLGRFTLAEGRYHAPADAARAVAAGADAVVVGSAITRPEHVTAWFVAAVEGAGRGADTRVPA